MLVPLSVLVPVVPVPVPVALIVPLCVPAISGVQSPFAYSQPAAPSMQHAGPLALAVSPMHAPQWWAIESQGAESGCSGC